MPGFITEVVAGDAISAGGVVDEILALDRENMTAFLAASGQPFPEAKRRAALTSGGATLVLIRLRDELVGYVDFTRSLGDPRDLYVGSLQIRPPFRRTSAIAVLLAACVRFLRAVPFRRLVSHVQANNTAARDLYSRLGFQICDRGRPNLEVLAGPELLASPQIDRLERIAARRGTLAAGGSGDD